jgi:hypothetical protein
MTTKLTRAELLAMTKRYVRVGDTLQEEKPAVLTGVRGASALPATIAPTSRTGRGPAIVLFWLILTVLAAGTLFVALNSVSLPRPTPITPALSLPADTPVTIATPLPTPPVALVTSSTLRLWCSNVAHDFASRTAYNRWTVGRSLSDCVYAYGQGVEWFKVWEKTYP